MPSPSMLAWRVLLIWIESTMPAGMAEKSNSRVPASSQGMLKPFTVVLFRRGPVLAHLHKLVFALVAREANAGQATDRVAQIGARQTGDGLDGHDLEDVIRGALFIYGSHFRRCACGRDNTVCCWDSTWNGVHSGCLPGNDGTYTVTFSKPI